MFEKTAVLTLSLLLVVCFSGCAGNLEAYQPLAKVKPEKLSQQGER